MKNLILWVVLAMGGLLTGCNGMVDTAAERHRRFNLINEFSVRQFVDDWDYIWLMEKNTRLTQWHPRVGS